MHLISWNFMANIAAIANVNWVWFKTIKHHHEFDAFGSQTAQTTASSSVASPGIYHYLLSIHFLCSFLWIGFGGKKQDTQVFGLYLDGEIQMFPMRNSFDFWWRSDVIHLCWTGFPTSRNHPKNSCESKGHEKFNPYYGYGYPEISRISCKYP